MTSKGTEDPDLRKRNGADPTRASNSRGDAISQTTPRPVPRPEISTGESWFPSRNQLDRGYPRHDRLAGAGLRSIGIGRGLAPPPIWILSALKHSALRFPKRRTSPVPSGSGFGTRYLATNILRLTLRGLSPSSTRPTSDSRQYHLIYLPFSRPSSPPTLQPSSSSEFHESGPLPICQFLPENPVAEVHSGTIQWFFLVVAPIMRQTASPGLRVTLHA
ncbi:hypothetical protein BO78DRAFT_430401 [Aspergillus sclerotiicarbonarius CBS 121057]|uniref:Uncharacterized protein n=1 Tax=Aspergillus sclerotiicarbonarius (strain CBS 121057 / IBT 28362) TaxID=1448318 RepID=A0A319E6Z2_ASPSB|nr:hypothetical protein BO78DRAFT_430401 [Aspergillus sclerotiicarbonarius CBS 121057]